MTFLTWRFLALAREMVGCIASGCTAVISEFAMLVSVHHMQVDIKVVPSAPVNLRSVGFMKPQRPVEHLNEYISSEGVPRRGNNRHASQHHASQK